MINTTTRAKVWHEKMHEITCEMPSTTRSHSFVSLKMPKVNFKSRSGKLNMIKLFTHILYIDITLIFIYYIIHVYVSIDIIHPFTHEIADWNSQAGHMRRWEGKPSSKRETLWTPWCNMFADCLPQCLTFPKNGSGAKAVLDPAPTTHGHGIIRYEPFL